MIRPSGGALLVAAAVVASGCLPNGLAFVQDKRLDVVAPRSHSTVKTTVTVRWQVHDFRITGRNGRASDDAGYFGVFVDRQPVPPGRPLSWVAHGDRQCTTTPGCPDAGYLADHDTYGTAKTSLTLQALSDQSAYHGHELHEVTIVLLNGRGDRIGESAFYVDFFYDRTGL